MTEKDKIYDELSRVLTEYEEGDASANALYETLVDIQNNWETVITVREED